MIKKRSKTTTHRVPAQPVGTKSRGDRSSPGAVVKNEKKNKKE